MARIDIHLSRMLCALLLPLASAAQQSPQPAAQLPAQAVSGYWATDAKFSSKIGSRTKGEYWWIGKTWGRIDPTGKFQFDADNGCSVSGLLTPYIGNSFSGTAQITNCQAADMNRRYTVSVGGGQTNLSVKISSNIIGPGWADEYEISGTFSRYRP